tara:strand:- start:923 stop:3514 length:2592 start_codon:yes stop_codon:yes gene_type:complete
MEQIYFSKNNYNSIYNYIGEILYNKLGIDISNDDNYNNHIVKIMKSVYSQKDSLGINFKGLDNKDISKVLSKKVVNISINYFENQKNSNQENNIKMNIFEKKPEQTKINNKKLQINSIDRNRMNRNIKSENKLDNRPQPSFVLEQDDVNKKYEELQTARSSLTNSTSDITPKFRDEYEEQDIDIKKKFENISRIREKEFSENANNDENPKNNAWTLNRKSVNSKSDINLDIENNLLPSINENNKTDLDSQFGLIMNNDSITNLKEKFENTSVQDRLNEFQNNIEIDKKKSELEYYNKDNQSTPINELINNSDNNIESFKQKQNIPMVNNSINELFKENIPMVNNSINELFKENIPKFNNSNNELLISNEKEDKTKQKTIKKNYSLIINSLDRQWYGEVIEKNGVFNNFESPYTNRYKYTVNFSSNPDTTIKIPIYQNNKYLPLNINNPDDKLKMLKGEMTLNDQNGFTWNGIHYNKYNPSNPKGEQKDYFLSLVKGGTQAINIDKTIKNIRKITLKRVIIPNDENISSSCVVTNRMSDTISKYNEDKKNTKGNNITPNDVKTPSYVDLNIGTKNLPYILIHIEEFNSNIQYTNNFNKNLFAKPFYDKEFKYKNDRGWIYYKNDDGDCVSYNNNTLSEINKLTIELLKPDGTTISDAKDDLFVTKLGWNGTTYNSHSLVGPNDSSLLCEYEFIILELNKYIHESNFKNGDKIIIKNLKFQSNETRLNSSKQAEITNFLENDSYVIRFDNDLYWYNMHDSGLNKTDLILKTNPLDNTMIQAHGDNNHRMINRILIQNKRTLNENNGTYSLFGSDINLISTRGYDYITGKPLDENDENMINVSGYLINTNLQHSLILDIETEENSL